MNKRNRLQIIFLSFLMLFTFGFKEHATTSRDANRTTIHKRSSSKSLKTVYTPSEVANQVKEIIIDELGIVDLNLVVNGASLTLDLGADELDLTEVRQEVNDYYGINITSGEAEVLETVGQWIDEVQQRAALGINPNQSLRNKIDSMIVARFECNSSLIADYVNLHDGYLGGDELTPIEFFRDIEKEFYFEMSDEIRSQIDTVLDLYRHVAYRTQ